ncbi:HAMP domain-containing sensor histidine kinase [Luteimonas sp. 3794]|uniref:sensor histidine kinase n=1 Tax=Luteimonas sp. 3794 TaxID=2817730 RepID=UPI00285F4E2D|nr:HAMP domain-containing sensor histidine kinase [Luteimonas sp. 3794]MDR6993198.1 nitrogen fixation/metabolism regulation signal transduction histidine kinase [Luteimonas sp. 3794]
MRWQQRLPLTGVVIVIALLHVALGAGLAVLLLRWAPPWMAVAGATLCAMPSLVWSLQRAFAPSHALFRALAGTVASYRDSDYGFGVSWQGSGALGDLVAAHNELGETLRAQRLSLVQRELLLDTMVQNTPVAMLLLNPADRVVHANLAARRALGGGRKLEGQAFSRLLADAPPALADAFARGGDGLFTIGDGDTEEIHHLSRRHFRLNGRRHELLLLRQMTTELRRQEVQTWKKVIRVISHELNNSLAPIASLAHSGAELLRRGQTARLPDALRTIEERARHLEGFIRGYAHFAKLPTPRREPIRWRAFLDQLRSQVPFVDVGPFDDAFTASFDAAQIEQALLNLLRNAHEAGGDPDAVAVGLRRAADGWRIDVLDRGPGMNEAVLANALLPFYSTKRNGTGLGLALAREIAEAHGGRIALLNREGGGLCGSLVLPD